MITLDSDAGLPSCQYTLDHDHLLPGGPEVALPTLAELHFFIAPTLIRLIHTLAPIFRRRRQKMIWDPEALISPVSQLCVCLSIRHGVGTKERTDKKKE